MSDLTDKLQAKREVLRHYTGVLRETREAMGVPLDAALAANGLCESLKSNYSETVEELDAQAMLSADQDYLRWLDEINEHHKGQE